MARLRNISSSVKKVGGWQKRLEGNALLSGTHGTAMVLPVDLQPGESVEIPQEALGDHVVVKLARSADFELIEVEAVPGSGQIDADPSVANGAVQLSMKALTAAELAGLAAGTGPIAVAMDALPASSLVHEVWVEVTAAAATVTTLLLDVGDGATVDLFANDLDLGATGLDKDDASLSKKWLPAGASLVLSLTSTGADVNATTALDAMVFVSYTVV
jgi:hypothetical protein